MHPCQPQVLSQDKEGGSRRPDGVFRRSSSSTAVTLGAIYGLIAIGYTMVYGIIGMINFAHGEVFMIGAFISLIGFLMLRALGIT